MYTQPPVASPEWQGFPVQSFPHGLKQEYLKNIYLLLLDSLMMHSRWTVIRVDLRVPKGYKLRRGAITQFIESVKHQLEHANKVKSAARKRTYDPMLRFAWVREWSDADNPHYHVVLMLNRDAYFTLGDYSKLQLADSNYDEMLAGRIYKAWGVALGLDWTIARPGVHLPKCPVSPLKVGDKNFQQQLLSVFYRLSYFAKYQTKLYGDGQRNFGMSQLRCLKTAHP